MAGPARASATSMPEPMLGRYRVVRRIGMGGMAEVLLARLEGPVAFERHVAIKRVLPHLAEDSELATMFVDEAHILARLRHPNIVAIEDFVHEGDRLFLVMEYLEGESLAACVRALATAGERFPFEVSAHIVAMAAAGVHAAHELASPDGTPLHLVHRDVNPKNVFVLFGGHVKVIDFGIARHRMRLAQTQTGNIKGTLRYMAPEQLTGSPVDRRTDVFGLGVMLAELLSMRPLFRRESEVATVNAILVDPLPDFRAIDPSIPAELDAIVRRAIARDPSERYASAKELCSELQSFVGALGSAEIESWLASWMEDRFAERRRSKLRSMRPESLVPESGSEPLGSAAPSELPPAPRGTAPTFAAIPRRRAAREADSDGAVTAPRGLSLPEADREAERVAELAWADPTLPTPSEAARAPSVPPIVLSPTPSVPTSGLPTSGLPTPRPSAFPVAPPPVLEPAPSPPSAPSPPRSTRTMSIGRMAFLGVAIGVVGAAIALRLTREPSPTTTRDASVVVLVPPPLTPPVIEAPPAAAIDVPEIEAPAIEAPAEPAASDSAADDVELRVSSDPEGAEVWIDGYFVGVTPGTFSVPPESSPSQIELRRSGRQPWRQSLVLDRDREITAALAPVARGERPTRPMGAGIEVEYP